MKNVFSITLMGILSLSIVCGAAVFTVSQDGSGQFSSIQEAVNAAGDNDIVKILDNAVYREQVVITGDKQGLTLTSTHPLASDKPTILFQDREHIHPTTAEEALHEDSIDFDQNGALRILQTKKITIDGLKIDGDGPFTFGGDAVWDGRHSQQSGNAAIAVFMSGDVKIRNCHITNAYIGINITDRNEGGIFANSNPADILPWRAVPLSGFGKTGNHLIEENRIHNNSFGMFFESTWDLGSTVRYNLFYENHHKDEAFAQDVIDLTAYGMDHTGGAFWFKDHSLSPLAIYNNTFWHNYVNFVGHWRAGGQHLIFNNIYSTPNSYWSEDPVFPNPYHALDPVFEARMKNCIFSTYSQPPSMRSQLIDSFVLDTAAINIIYAESLFVGFDQIRIMNNMSEVEVKGQKIDLTFLLASGEQIIKTVDASWAIRPGALITEPFPAEANVRWLETDYQDDVHAFKLFKSTDPADEAFLEPDWDNPFVQQFIVDQGWAEAGIRDADGSIADLGAIAHSGHPTDNIAIMPSAPVIIDGTTAVLRFDLAAATGIMTNPTVKYFRYIQNVEFQADAFGSSADPLPSGDIVNIPINSPVKIGANTLLVEIPQRNPSDLYAFFEMVIEGTGSDGEIVASNVGFLPYRSINYHVEVSVLNSADSSVMDTIVAGDTTLLHITAYASDSIFFQETIENLEINLNSGSKLLNPDTEELTINSLTESIIVPAVFTKVPEGEAEYIQISGQWSNPETHLQLSFYGTSNGITILPGEVAKVSFQDPASSTVSPTPTVIDTGEEHQGNLYVLDRYDNKVNTPVQVTISSLSPETGDIVGGTQDIETNESGIGYFFVQVKEGEVDEIFSLRAELDNGESDQADMKVGDGTTSSVTIPLKPRQQRPTMSFAVYMVNGREILNGKAHSFEHITQKMRAQGIGRGVFLIRMQSLKGKPIGMRRITTFR